MRLLQIIEEQIKENSKIASYSKISVLEKTSSVPTVGIWWYLRGKVLKVEDVVENCNPAETMCVSQEHNKVWAFVQKKYAEEIPEILEVAFNQVERGRVWFVLDKERPTRKQFLITCSSTIAKDKIAVARIKESFGISAYPVKVQAQPGLYDREIKLR